MDQEELRAVLEKDATIRLLRGEIDSLKKQVKKAVSGEEIIVRAITDLMAKNKPKLTVFPPRQTVKKKGCDEEVFVLHLSDIHIGKVTPQYDSAIAVERLNRIAKKVLKIAETRRNGARVEDIRVYLGGDMVEGEGIFPTQAHLIDSSVFDQACKVVPEALASLILTFLANFGSVRVLAVPGNHGRNGSKHTGANPRTNWDSVAYEVMRLQVQSRLASQDRKRVSFDLPGDRSEDWYGVDQVYSWGNLLVHGQEIRGGFAGFPWYGAAKKAWGWIDCIPVPWDYLWIGHFHCVLPNTMIESAVSGLRPISDFAGHSERFRDSNELLVTDDVPRRASQTFHHGAVVPTIRIKTNMGYALEGTPNHRVRVITTFGDEKSVRDKVLRPTWRKVSQYEWRRLDQITPRDCVVIQLGTTWPIEDPLLNHISYSNQSRRLYVSNRPQPLPVRLTEDWAEFLGWWVADGNYTTSNGKFNGINLAVHEDDLSHVTELLKRLSIRYGSRIVNNCEKVTVFWAYSKDLVKFMNETLGLQSGAANKNIPWAVLQGTEPINRAFLRGLFRGDGYVLQGYPTLSTNSSILAEQTQQVLRRLGILSYRSRKRRIGSHNILREGPQKGYTIRAKNDSWIVRISKSSLDKTQSLFGAGIKHLLLQQELEKCRADYNDRGILTLTRGRKKTQCGPHTYDRVKEITHHESDVMDFSQPETETFIGNGFVCHNTMAKFDINRRVVLANGSTESYNVYARQELGAMGWPAQRLAVFSKSHGIISDEAIYLDEARQPNYERVSIKDI